MSLFSEENATSNTKVLNHAICKFAAQMYETLRKYPDHYNHNIKIDDKLQDGEECVIMTDPFPLTTYKSLRDYIAEEAKKPKGRGKKNAVPAVQTTPSVPQTNGQAAPAIESQPSSEHDEKQVDFSSVINNEERSRKRNICAVSTDIRMFLCALFARASEELNHRLTEFIADPSAMYTRNVKYNTFQMLPFIANVVRDKQSNHKNDIDMVLSSALSINIASYVNDKSATADQFVRELARIMALFIKVIANKNAVNAWYNRTTTFSFKNFDIMMLEFAQEINMLEDYYGIMDGFMQIMNSIKIQAATKRAEAKKVSVVLSDPGDYLASLGIQAPAQQAPVQIVAPQQSQAPAQQSAFVSTHQVLASSHQALASAHQALASAQQPQAPAQSPTQ